MSQNSAFRGGSPSRAVQPTLADLEFPPPPTDLPPPPEEFDPSTDVIDGGVIMTSSTELRRKIVPISPLLSSRKVGACRDAANSTTDGNEHGDVSTLQPSVEEASSRLVIVA